MTLEWILLSVSLAALVAFIVFAARRIGNLQMELSLAQIRERELLDSNRSLEQQRDAFQERLNRANQTLLDSSRVMAAIDAENQGFRRMHAPIVDVFITDDEDDAFKQVKPQPEPPPTRLALVSKGQDDS